MHKFSKETAVGLFMVIGLGCVVYMAVNLGKVSVFSDDRYSLFARFDKVSGLRIGNPVNMLGLEVGRVVGFRLDQQNQVAVVELELDKSIQIYDDAIAAIKTEGLIGDKYVEIDAGGGGELLQPGDTIIETVSPIDFGDIIGKYAFGSVDDEK